MSFLRAGERILGCFRIRRYHSGFYYSFGIGMWYVRMFYWELALVRLKK